ncbi:MAG: 2-oxo acid dehydrogenase subunit E2 [Bdellovibrio sp.]|nr:2-oxo acid dehydrogenase subunit E2 [Bdellovibrio sp.]
MGKVALRPLRDTSVFRKMAMGTWAVAKDPTVYGLLEIDLSKTLALLDDYQKKHNVKITPAHLVGKAVAYCMQRRPEINGMIRGKKIYLREHVSLFYQVNIPGEGADKITKATLSGAVLHEAEHYTLAKIAEELARKAQTLREGKDLEIKRNMELFRFIPWRLTGLYLDFVSWLMYGLNLDLSFLGVPKDPFGSIMITNIGGLGLDIAFAPLVPYSRVPVLLAVGAITEKPCVVDKKIVIRPILPIGATFDHRLIDGIHASQMAHDFKKCFNEPEKYLFNSAPSLE